MLVIIIKDNNDENHSKLLYNMMLHIFFFGIITIYFLQLIYMYIKIYLLIKMCMIFTPSL